MKSRNRSIHWSARPNRRLVTIHRIGSASKRRDEEENDEVSVGVDLHKGQFTVYWRSEGGTKGRWEKYSTGEESLNVFIGKLKTVKETGYECEVAVESTGNTRHFKRRVEGAGVM